MMDKCTLFMNILVPATEYMRVPKSWGSDKFTYDDWFVLSAWLDLGELAPRGTVAKTAIQGSHFLGPTS